MKNKINMEFVIFILAFVNILYTGFVFWYTRRSIQSRILVFEESMRFRYDKMVCQIIADGLSNLHTSYTNQFSEVVQEQVPLQNDSVVQSSNLDESKSISPLEVDEPYQYFENCGVATVKLRDKYYIEGDTISPFGEIMQISPYQITFSNNYVINNYKRATK